MPGQLISGNSKNGAKISIEEPGVASCRQVRDNDMASVSQASPYQCDQCGTTNIVAAPLLYEQGTRTYSGPFHSGISQSFSAQAVAPPKPHGYARPLLLWGFGILIFSVWVLVGFSLVVKHPTITILEKTAMFALPDIACIAGLLVSLRKVARYNREVYQHLYWNWEHTYICRRCGRSLFIPS